MSQRCQEVTWQAQSIRALPNHIDYVSTRRTDSQDQLLSCNRDKALLVRGIPAWKGTAFDVNCDAALAVCRLPPSSGEAKAGRSRSSATVGSTPRRNWPSLSSTKSRDRPQTV